MSAATDIASHYARGSLTAAIESALAKAGIDRADVTIDDLAPVDEFHIGGSGATVHLLSHLDLTEGRRVLDVGCGIGGTARHLAREHGARVCGVDLTEEFVETGRALDRWTSMEERIELRVADAATLPFDDGAFDAAVMLHVGMNVEDKGALFSEVARTLGSGGRFAIYDIMRVGDGEAHYPVPWAGDATIDFTESPEAYERHLADAGFEVIHAERRTEAAREFFGRARAAADAPGGPPPLGLHLIAGPEIGARVGNVAAMFEAGRLVPVEMIAARP